MFHSIYSIFNTGESPFSYNIIIKEVSWRLNFDHHSTSPSLLTAMLVVGKDELFSLTGTVNGH